MTECPYYPADMSKRRTGIILAYSQDAKAGVAQAADGRKYLFLWRHWRSEGLPEKGESVVFYAMRRGRAAHVKRQIKQDAGNGYRDAG